MSAVTAIHEQHAAEKARLAIVRDDAAARLYAHERATAAKAAQLAAFEADYAANATAEALGLEPTRALPDATALEKLRADASVAEPVRCQLAINLERCEAALEKAKAEHRKAISLYLRTDVLQPTLGELEEAWDSVRCSLVKIMAIHKLAFVEFDDRAKTPNCYNDLFGPAAHFVSALREMGWENWPYSVRPDWVRSGRVGLHGLAGVDEHIAELRVEVEQVRA
ncbi:hypothetical protein KZ810_07135 [Sphingomonas sp. RHCKR47]|uniref:hypothetical protein n=1 Tax=Sphingomonas citricola TaxID=2862498 RepID=UPI001CA5F3C8|nr:hypothetical protein [Sphingomonas citricola]MBW6523271.1 hypothetical protein [Sphingomonas citricola]